MDPQLNRAYLKGALVGVAVAALVVVVLITSGILRFAAPEEDEEEQRPPVVVSNGSVKVGVPTLIPVKKRGQFKSVTGATVYRHAGDNEGNDKSVTSLDLLIEGATATGCTDEVTGLKALTIVTSQGAIEIGLRPRGGSGSKVDALFTFPSNVTKPVNYRLELADHTLQAVTFDSGGSPKTCTFDAPTDAERVLRIWAR